MNDILARNAELQAEFGRLSDDPCVPAEAWEALAMRYLDAGYPLNAGTCFIRADAVRDARPVEMVSAEVV